MGSLRNIVRAVLPREVRTAVGELAWRAQCDLRDAAETLAGKHDALTPPRRMWQLVTARDADFHASGAGLLDLLRTNGLQPDHAILDVGCGIGRAAAPLTRFLNENGRYDGIDIMPDAIAWCQRAITPRFPRFQFHLADVHSDRYHPHGGSTASTYAFPLADRSVDFVFLASVFTHMLPDDLRNYLKEIARVMRPGARCVISYYLLNDERRTAMAAGKGAFTFRFGGEGYLADVEDLPEAAVAYEQSVILDLYRGLGLDVLSETLGQWPYAPIQDQDVIVARKSAA